MTNFSTITSTIDRLRKLFMTSSQAKYEVIDDVLDDSCSKLAGKTITFPLENASLAFEETADSLIITARNWSYSEACVTTLEKSKGIIPDFADKTIQITPDVSTNMSTLLTQMEETARLESCFDQLLNLTSNGQTIPTTQAMSIVESFERSYDPCGAVKSLRQTVGNMGSTVNGVSLLSVARDMMKSCISAVNETSLTLPDDSTLYQTQAFLLGIVSGVITVIGYVAAAVLAAINAFFALIGVIFAGIGQAINWFNTNVTNTQANPQPELISLGNTYFDKPIWVGSFEPEEIKLSNLRNHLQDYSEDISDGRVIKMSAPGIDLFFWADQSTADPDYDNFDHITKATLMKWNGCAYGNGSLDLFYVFGGPTNMTTLWSAQSYAGGYDAVLRFEGSGNIHGFYDQYEGRDEDYLKVTPYVTSGYEDPDALSNSILNFMDFGYASLSADLTIKYRAQYPFATVVADLLSLFCLLSPDFRATSGSGQVGILQYGGSDAGIDSSNIADGLSALAAFFIADKYQFLSETRTRDEFYNRVENWSNTIKNQVYNLYDSIIKHNFTYRNSTSNNNRIDLSGATTYSSEKNAALTGRTKYVFCRYKVNSGNTITVYRNLKLDFGAVNTYAFMYTSYSEDEPHWINNLWWENVEEHPFTVATYPVTYGLESPSLSYGYLVKALIIAGAVIAAVAVASAVAIFKIRKFMARKQTEASMNLLAKKKAYEEGDISYDEYWKAQKRYNRKAKLFGWGTFDASNGWYNAPETDSGAAQNSTNEVNSIVTERTSDLSDKSSQIISILTKM